MTFLRNVRIILLSCVVIYQSQALGENKQNDDERFLMSYLSQEQSVSVSKLIVQDLINKGQVFFLDYIRKEPFKNDSERDAQKSIVDSLSKKGIFVARFSNWQKDEIHATFSRFIITDSNPEPASWLELMALPIKAGYELKSVRIIYQPSTEIKTQSFEKSQKVITQINNELIKNKTEYKQLSEYDQVKISAGKLDGGNRIQSYPYSSYEYGYGKEIPNTKGLQEKTTENWCRVQIMFDSEKGGLPQAKHTGNKVYPRQGIETYWDIESDNQEFNKKVLDIVIKSLTVLDEYEQELEKSQSVSSVAARIKENAEKLNESDKELTRKWDLPEDVIAQTPTDKLFLHFINSPSVAMLMLYDTPEPGLTRLLNANNTLREFYNRDDMVQGALKMYSEYDLSPESMSDKDIKDVYSRSERTRNSSFIQNHLTPDNIVNMKIARITLNIMYADEILLSKQFLPKLKGYEREFLKAMLERYEKIVDLRQKYGEDFAPAVRCVPQFCICMAENLDKELFNKLKAIEPVGEGQKQFMEEVRKYLN